jgi:hypothetical protein
VNRRRSKNTPKTAVSIRETRPLAASQTLRKRTVEKGVCQATFSFEAATPIWKSCAIRRAVPASRS